METLIYILLGLTSVAGLGVMIWRGWVLRWERTVPSVLAKATSECRTQPDFEKLRDACRANPSPLGRLLLVADEHRDLPKADTEAAVETAARQEIVKLEQGLVVLEVIVGIAPLLGLVGTILGMMTVFGDIGQSGLANVSDASKLARGISLILQATLVGLLISIPTLVAWSFFTKRVEVFAIEMETICGEFIRRQYAVKK